jgi:hypothetical protein
MTTPSQLAKDFAAQHGFTITPEGRRYVLSHKGNRAGVPDLWATDVGGYRAALNAMKARIEDLRVANEAHAVDMQAADTAAFDNPNDQKLLRRMDRWVSSQIRSLRRRACRFKPNRALQS